jgi:hypothetical protein
VVIILNFKMNRCNASYFNSGSANLKFGPVNLYNNFRTVVLSNYLKAMSKLAKSSSTLIPSVSLSTHPFISLDTQ